MFSESFQNARPSAKFEVGKVIGLTFGAIGRNWLAFLVLAVVLVGLPTMGENYLFPNVAARPALSIDALWDPLVGIVQGATLNALFAAIVASLIWGQEHGERPRIASSVRATLAAAVWIILVALVRELSEMVGLILLIVPGVIAVLALWVAIPVCIVERLGVVASIRRSLELTRGQRGQLFLMLIVIWLLVVVFPAFLIGVAAKLIYPLVAAGSFNLGHLSFGLKSAYGNLIYASAYACAYVELRSLKEGVGADSVARVFA